MKNKTIICGLLFLLFNQILEAKTLTNKLEKHFGQYYELQEVAKQILCELDGIETTDKDIYNYIEQNSYNNVEQIEHFSSTNSNYKTIDIKLGTNSQHKLSLRRSEDKTFGARYGISISKITNRFFDNHDYIDVTYNTNCTFMNATVYTYDDTEDLEKITKLNSSGDIVKTTYADREIFSLENIYHSQSINKIRQISQRDDRVLITIFDTGVDYNHPMLAYKIPRENSNFSDYELAEIKTLEKEINILEEEIRPLEQHLKSSSRLLKWVNKLRYKNKLKTLNSRLISKKSDLYHYQLRSIGWDYFSHDNTPYDYDDYGLFSIGPDLNHGTHVAAIASNECDDIAILPIRAPSTDNKDYYDAIKLAYDKGSRIVNISMGTSGDTPLTWLKKAIEDFPDILFIVAAGNEKDDLDKNPHYPAAFDHSNLLVVASVDKNNNLSSFSNYSQNLVDIGAHGEYIKAATPENTYGKKSGTSMATPNVTRVAGKIKYANPSFSPEDIIEIIKVTSTKVESLKGKIKFGSVINESKAITEAQSW